MKPVNILIIIIFSLLVFAPACSKHDFLNKLPNSEIVIPTTLPEIQAMLDDDETLPQTPAFPLLSEDRLFFSGNFFTRMKGFEFRAYIWDKKIYNDEKMVDDWRIPYLQIQYANVALDGLGKKAYPPFDSIWAHALEGSALFVRAYANFGLVQVFAPPYNAATADVDKGIPLVFKPGVNEKPPRATMKETYTAIISDLQHAVHLLPSAPHAAYRNRPSAAAAYALLSRVYLSMRDYGNAGLASDSCLELYDVLIDYNHVNVDSALYVFTFNNEETLYQSHVQTNSSINLALAFNELFIDTSLYKSYLPDDLRKSVFYKISPGGEPLPRYRYSGYAFPFTGLATDEVYINRAECYARLGNKTAALQYLNALLRKRMRDGRFDPVESETPEQALQIILREREFELAFRGQRWSDLRRFMMEGNGMTLKKEINGQSYHLPPGDPRWVLPIPEMAIMQGNISQNPR